MRTICLIFAHLLFSMSVFSQSWSLTGNDSITTADFLGSKNNAPLLLKVNNQLSGFTGFLDKYNVSFGYFSISDPLTAGNNNSAFGAQALRQNTAGSWNVAIGAFALDYNLTGGQNVAIGGGACAQANGGANYNVAVGYNALFKNGKDGNTAVGFEAGLVNTEGESLTAVGFKALRNNTTGIQNTAHGFNALFNNTTGVNNTAVGAWSMVANTEGNHNTAVGIKSLFSNSTGEFNTAVGAQSLEINTTGEYNAGFGAGALGNNTTGARNTAVGTSALWENTTGYDNTALGEEALGGNFEGTLNTAVGSRALWSHDNTTNLSYGRGQSNTAVGYEALREISTGGWNVGIGVHALRVDSTGSDNIAIGCSSLNANSTGTGNVAAGSKTLFTNKTGCYNTAVGYQADAGSDSLTNTTVIGSGALATSSNQVIIGSSSVTSIRGFVQWTAVSDGRVEKNVKSNVPGLDFIKTLKPVTYNLNMDSVEKITGNPQGIINHPVIKAGRDALQKRIFTGLIGQDVEKAAQSIGYDFSGLDVEKNGLYGLRYSEFIVPVIKAVQELSAQNEEKDLQIASLQQRITQLEEATDTTTLSLLKQKVEALTEMVNSLWEKVNGQPAAGPAQLEQNYPNPFNQSTTINYSLPQTFSSAEITITDASGKVYKHIPVTGSGSGNIKILAGSLPAGLYLYSLRVDNALIDTKKMVSAK